MIGQIVCSSPVNVFVCNIIFFLTWASIWTAHISTSNLQKENNLYGQALLLEKELCFKRHNMIIDYKHETFVQYVLHTMKRIAADDVKKVQSTTQVWLCNKRKVRKSFIFWTKILYRTFKNQNTPQFRIPFQKQKYVR